jgi:hypothetical protein
VIGEKACYPKRADRTTTLQDLPWLEAREKEAKHGLKEVYSLQLHEHGLQLASPRKEKVRSRIWKKW